ncbi:hypothetical protein HanIR_Chr12g0614741 [Helianthus annuus]|nr:hypothetical protein HanIR_Chr12g0614741 [Helianthus annuus]
MCQYNHTSSISKCDFLISKLPLKNEVNEKFINLVFFCIFSLIVRNLYVFRVSVFSRITNLDLCYNTYESIKSSFPYFARHVKLYLNDIRTPIDLIFSHKTQNHTCTSLEFIGTTVRRRRPNRIIARGPEVAGTERRSTGSLSTRFVYANNEVEDVTV